MGSSHCWCLVPSFVPLVECSSLCRAKNVQSIVMLSWAGQLQGQGDFRGGQAR